ncbi:hypothetical protein GCM10022247_14030 [Allokutzneria multivorans]|uniref:Uncharacterized protein n=1 Tax=Allokutzneria multivorans TaxID=1142134 RepID=A0ABP7RCG8_9PSEU
MVAVPVVLHAFEPPRPSGTGLLITPGFEELRPLCPGSSTTVFPASAFVLGLAGAVVGSAVIGGLPTDIEVGSGAALDGGVSAGPPQAVKTRATDPARKMLKSRRRTRYTVPDGARLP